MKQILALALSMALTGSLYAADPPQDSSAPASKTTKARAKAPTVASQLNELKEAIEAQQKQIQELGQQVQSRDQRIQQLEQKIDQSQSATAQAQTKADAAASQTAEQAQTVTVIKSDVADIKSNATNMAQTLQETQKTLHEEIESPLAIHFKGITITPGGFLAAESVYRNRALGADINTPFNSVSMPGAGQNDISEFYGSGRQSRISMLAEGKLKDLKMSGYYEADFLSAGVTSTATQSNSYTMRQRQVWGQIANDEWSLTGGQQWSLLTETRKGMDNRSEALPMTIDPQYHVGFSWARQYGIRVVRNFDKHFWLGASLENPQTTFGGHGNETDFALGSAGNTSGLYNSGTNYSFNAMPDFVFKAAAEPGFGHYEVFGVLSRFRDRVYPCGQIGPVNTGLCNATASAAGAYNDSKTSGAFGANARVTVAKQWDFGVHFMTGEGVGRYGSSNLPDATVNPDGTLALIRSYQALGTIEWHSKRIDVYMNAGEEYAGRHWAFDANQPDSKNPTYTLGTPVGYGSPYFVDSGCFTETAPPSGAAGYTFGSLANCSGDTQRLIEGTAGFWIKLHQGPHGRLQFGPQYSYVTRQAWTGNNGVAGPGELFYAPHGIDNMFFTSFRYYLP